MMKIVPLVCLVLFGLAVSLVSSRWNEPPAGGPPSAFVSAATAPVPSADSGGPAASEKGIREATDSGHRVMMRFLGDLDDVLDEVRDPASFEAAKPRLMARVREHGDWVAQQPGRGMAQLSRAAAKEFSQAANRHGRSLQRAEEVAPGVLAFFEKELGPLLQAK